jgi:hypothetical protein
VDFLWLPGCPTSAARKLVIVKWGIRPPSSVTESGSYVELKGFFGKNVKGHRCRSLDSRIKGPMQLMS